MANLKTLYQIIKADFLERTRSYGFFVTLIITLYGASFFLPDKHAGYMALAVRGVRGVYTSGWVGLSVAVSTSLLLGLSGFYLVKNAIERDERTRVGQLFAASPTSKYLFIAGKALSNFLVLTSIVVATLLSAVVMFFIRAESQSFNLMELISPFILITLPTLLVVSAVAILFENIKWLKNGLGNVAYFFIWMISLIIPVQFMNDHGGVPELPFMDLFGFYKIIALINTEVAVLFPNTPSSGGLFSSAGPEGASTFLWAGLTWTPDMYAGRLFYTLLAVGIILISAMLFNRFDEGKVGRLTHVKKRTKSSAKAVKRKKRMEVFETEWVAPITPFSALEKGDSRSPFAFVHVVLAELKIMLKGMNNWWYIGLIGLNVLAVVIPDPRTLAFILPGCWILPIFVWSSMGSREYKHKTAEIIFSCAGTMRLQFAAMVLSGVIVTAVSGLGPLVKMLMIGNTVGAMSWLAAVGFIPLSAICLGAWSRTPKVFESLYIVLWYIGPINGLVYLDYIGVVDASAQLGMPLVYGALAIAALVLAVIQRRAMALK